ncbi:MAG: hypothetical protein ACK4N4_08660 [Burkholderiales bacterium]
MRHTIPVLVTAAVFISAGADSIAAPDQDTSAKVVKREIIPGSELMTHAEREQYRQRIRGARSADEEARIRADHRKQIEERARRRGLRLADPLPAAAQK